SEHENVDVRKYQFKDDTAIKAKPSMTISFSDLTEGPVAEIEKKQVKRPGRSLSDSIPGKLVFRSANGEETPCMPVSLRSKDWTADLSTALSSTFSSANESLRISISYRDYNPRPCRGKI